jgi:hypothetical protein
VCVRGACSSIAAANSIVCSGGCAAVLATPSPKPSGSASVNVTTPTEDVPTVPGPFWCNLCATDLGKSGVKSCLPKLREMLPSYCANHSFTPAVCGCTAEDWNANNPRCDALFSKVMNVGVSRAACCCRLIDVRSSAVCTQARSCQCAGIFPAVLRVC